VARRGEDGRSHHLRLPLITEYIIQGPEVLAVLA
jgi:hypothetical protein